MTKFSCLCFLRKLHFSSFLYPGSPKVITVASLKPLILRLCSFFQTYRSPPPQRSGHLRLSSHSHTQSSACGGGWTFLLLRAVGPRLQFGRGAMKKLGAIASVLALILNVLALIVSQDKWCVTWRKTDRKRGEKSHESASKGQSFEPTVNGVACGVAEMGESQGFFLFWVLAKVTFEWIWCWLW